jgi:hypothetical protein
MPPSALDRLGELVVLEYFFSLENVVIFHVIYLFFATIFSNLIRILCSIFAY